MKGREVCHAHSGEKVGRPSALTPEVHSRIVQLVKAGCPGSIAARAAGISESTFFEIKRIGRLGDSGPERALIEAIDQAEAEAFGHAVLSLRRDIGTPGNYRAALAYIDRFHRGRFTDGGDSSNDRRPGVDHPPTRRPDLSRLSEQTLAELEALHMAPPDD